MIANCKYCNKKFTKLKSEMQRTKNNFCSKSCAAKYLNVKHPKRKLTRRCKTCNKLIKSSRIYCSKKCNPNLLNIYEKTLKETTNIKGTGSNRYRAIRDHAHSLAKKLNILNECSMCGHQLVVTCHIKEIHNFSPDTPISEVNNQDNLIGLCRNCHWKLDHGMIDKKIVEAKIALRNKQLTLF